MNILITGTTGYIGKRLIPILLKEGHKLFCCVRDVEEFRIMGLKTSAIEKIFFMNVYEIDRIIQMAWEDRTTFDAIKFQFSLKEQDVIELMRREMKPNSFKRWRKRVQGRKTKHQAKRVFAKGRFKCTRQKQISNNKIAKR